MKKAGLNGCVYDFLLIIEFFYTSNIIDVQKYLMKKMI